jgi:hypothetical protein
VAQQLAGSVPALSATTLSCTGGQVNVAGSVITQNLIALSGGCAVYAHTRYDAASGTYSDLGNLSVYTDGQGWTGTCTANSNFGSTNALCADGFELTGHATPSCGPAGTSYLLPGVKSINPNPCAAGTGPQPVAPLSTSLPPEPNTDPVAIATLQGTGGAACSATGPSYPNIVVGTTTVATGLGPSPLLDPSGYYHFKPSCYGYINAGALGGGGPAIANVQTGPEGIGFTSVTSTLPVASTAGNLLVATIHSFPSAVPFTGSGGWVFASGTNEANVGRVEIWYYPNNPGGITTATFGIGFNAAVSQLSEWSGVAAVPLDRVGSTTVTSASTTATISSSGAMAVANELVITNIGYAFSGGSTFTPGSGWAGLANDPTIGFSSDYRLNLPAGVASETVTLTAPTEWSVAIATFKPAAVGAGVPGAAVLDPGFYYFNGWNGSSFLNGGGICLNGATLLARDVTLEFVNQAGFSSGTCAPGGGAICAAPCQFGSPPCSIQVCPPNVGADSPNNLTWFAAPCFSAPAGDAASCPGSSWCLPAGDRSCTNVLIWAAASNTGQIAIVGAAARHWLLGSIYWPGTCTDTVNGNSTIAGTLFCGNLTISAGAGAGIAVGGDYGIATSLAEAVLVE